MSRPILTALVSTYNSERFLPGCLDDLIEQTIFQDMEIIVIDSGSLQGERMICETYCRQHRNIQYTRTARESLYSAWNRAIGQSNVKVHNFRYEATDDLHARDGLQQPGKRTTKMTQPHCWASANQYREQCRKSVICRLQRIRTTQTKLPGVLT
jgi:glycosyltransferase involved in cell wall biosynthesis